jgi:transposase
MRAIGLDVHKHFAEVAVAEPGQGIVRRERIPVTPASLRHFAAQLGADDQVVLEASFNTWAVAELLGKHAGRVIVSNPMRTRAIASAKVKTDQVDASILAQLLAADFIPAVWIPDAATRDLRRLVSEHRGLVIQRSQLRNRIHAILHRNLIECPYTDAFGRSGLRWLAAVRLPAAERRETDRLRRVLCALELEIDGIETELAQTGLHHPGLRHLITVPGIGLLTAITLLAVIGDIKRFPRPNRLVGYLGLDPRVRQSGDRPAYTGHISRQGQAHARGLLLEAAHSAVRVPGPLRAFYQRVRSRRGSQIALVAVARKLTTLAWHLLTKETDYQWARPSLRGKKWRLIELRAGLPKGAVHGIWTRGNREQEDAVLLQAEAAYRGLVAARSEHADAAAPMRKRLEGQRPDARRRSHPHPPLFSRGSAASSASIVLGPETAKE